MSEGDYKILNQAAIHFITFAVVDWVDFFTRKGYHDIFPESIRYCEKEKDRQVHSWCVMSNHVHFIVSEKNGNLSDVLSDFYLCRVFFALPLLCLFDQQPKRRCAVAQN